MRSPRVHSINIWFIDGQLCLLNMLLLIHPNISWNLRAFPGCAPSVFNTTKAERNSRLLLTSIDWLKVEKYLVLVQNQSEQNAVRTRPIWFNPDVCILVMEKWLGSSPSTSLKKTKLQMNHASLALGCVFNKLLHNPMKSFWYYNEPFTSSIGTTTI